MTASKTTTNSKTPTPQEPTMHALSTVIDVTADTDLTPDARESILAAIESHLAAGNAESEIRPYVAGEHSAPVHLANPLIVVTGITLEQMNDGDYFARIKGARYSEEFVKPHPLSELFRKHGRPGDHGLTIVPAWEDVRVGDAHIIGRRDTSPGGAVLPSGVLAGRIDLTLKIAVGRDSVDPQITRNPRR